MNAKDLDQLFQHFNNKIETIYSLIPLSQLYEDLIHKNDWNRNAVFDSNHFHSGDSKKLSDKRPDLGEISQMVIEMKTMTEEVKLLLKQQKQTIVSQSHELDNDLERIQRHCLHINQNIPTFLQNNKTDKVVDKKAETLKRPVIDPKPNASRMNAKTNPRPKATESFDLKTKTTQEIKSGAKSVRKKAVRKDLLGNIGSISFITTEEFDSIPQYMLGRLTYEVINRAIADFNRTIGSKYKLIANYCNKYSDEEMRRYVKFKEQENSETEGQYFCTIGDLKELSDLKSEPTIRKVLTCLRHCKRIREIRGNPPKLVRYAIIINPMI